MITPASVADWVMFVGLLGTLGGYAAFGYRSILEEARTEKVEAAASRWRVTPA